MFTVLLVQKHYGCFIFSFSELKTIRIAFDVYECQDLSGMEVCPHIILRTLKVNPYRFNVSPLFRLVATVLTRAAVLATQNIFNLQTNSRQKIFEEPIVLAFAKPWINENITFLKSWIR
jgi:hypothetical protein